MVAAADGQGLRSRDAQAEEVEGVEQHARGGGAPHQGAHEFALAADAVEVAARGGAGAHVPEGGGAVEFLAAGLDVQAREGVVDGFGGAHLDAAHGVDDVGEAAEPDFGVVVDADAGGLFHGLHQQRGAAEGEGGVDFVHAVAGDVHVGVAGDGHEPAAADGREVGDHDGVGALPEVLAAAGGQRFGVVLGHAGAGVGADEQPVRGQGAAGPVVVAGEGVDAVEVQVDPHGAAAEHEQQHQQDELQLAAQAAGPPVRPIARAAGEEAGRFPTQ